MTIEELSKLLSKPIEDGFGNHEIQVEVSSGVMKEIDADNTGMFDNFIISVED